MGAVAAGDGGTFGAVLRGFRWRARLTQEELAERSGVSVRTIRSLERDRLLTPRWSSLRALAQALGLDTQDRQRFDRLAGGDDEAPAAPGGGLIPVSLSLLVGRQAEV